MTKAPTPAEMSKGQGDNTNNATKKFDYTDIADRLRTVNWSNYFHNTIQLPYKQYIIQKIIWLIMAKIKILAEGLIDFVSP